MNDIIFKKAFKIKVKRKYTGKILPDRTYKAPKARKLPRSMTTPSKAFVTAIKSSDDTGTDRYAKRVEAKLINKKVGFGVFARQNISKGIIGIYTGKLKKHKGASYSRYLFCFRTKYLKDVVIDGQNAGNWTTLMNHSSYTSKARNIEVKEYFYEGLPYILFKAIKPIKKGDQLLYDYGDDYWKCLKVDPASF